MLKKQKYAALSQIHEFVPLAIETSGIFITEGFEVCQENWGSTADGRPFNDPKGNLWFQLLQVSTKEIRKAFKTFPLGSTGCPDGLTPQHLKDLLAEAPDNNC